MNKAEIVKFRATAKQKAELMATAASHHQSVSKLLRNAVLHVVAGRPADGSVRADMAKLRQSANEIQTILLRGRLSPEALARALQLIETMRQIASHHLGALQ